ncbi:phosphate acyltransferase PlsX [Enterococcus timonensis]|uniref:phosphate acyltransferase PlsX n=1 Tax=Enterococcus timonensis TaxID=1852364 RepID=UPI0008D9CD2A|nr:phosphate acyltransferase PlsX [Enterococcus timonensis]
MKIAVDAMGGDFAPKAIVEGVLLAHEKTPEIEFILFGDQEQINPLLTSHERITVVHTTEKITGDDEPVKAIRRKKQASMVLAAQAVKNREADAMFSAGNTGALLACGLLIVGRIKNIERPGLLSTLPVVGSDAGFDMIDLGANADNRPEHLVNYAILGSFYAEKIRHIKNPRVALLNNGTEDSKGNELTKETFGRLKENFAINFIGNVEARDLLKGAADVVVTDGFTGNAVLKSIEGTAMTMMDLIKASINEAGVRGKVGALLLKPALRNVKHALDYSSHGGAVLFGLKAPVIKTHGSTEKEAVAQTIYQIEEMVKSGLIPDLVAHFEEEKA